MRRFNRLKKHRSAAKAARIVGVSVVTLWRWQQRFDQHGAAGLTRKPPGPARKVSPFAAVRFTAGAMRELEKFHVAHLGKIRQAWQAFANGSAGCPPIVAAYVQRHGKAPAVLARLGQLQAVQARCYASADGKRLYVKLPTKGILSASLAVPAGVQLRRTA